LALLLRSERGGTPACVRALAAEGGFRAGGWWPSNPIVRPQRARIHIMAARNRAVQRLPPEVNRALYVRNLPFKITAEEMYDIFGKFGAIRQIRLGNAQDTRGTAFVVYEDIYDAKTAVDHLSGFNVCGRYLVVLYYQQTKMQKRQDTEREQKELAEMRARLGIDSGDGDVDLSRK
jgi:pre-mRNA branch site protein p14